MKIVYQAIVGIVLLLTLNACSGKKTTSAFDIEKLNAEMKAEGWSHHEILGTLGESIAETRLESETGRSITAFWVANGKRNEKVYQQTNFNFVVISVQKSDGDTFAVVFNKARRR